MRTVTSPPMESLSRIAGGEDNYSGKVFDGSARTTFSRAGVGADNSYPIIIKFELLFPKNNIFLWCFPQGLNKQKE